EPAGIDDEPDPVRHEVFDRRVEVLEEGRRIALGAVLRARLAEDQHRDLGEIVTGEDVDAAGSRQVGHGRSPVPVEARAVPDADRCRSHELAPAVATGRALVRAAVLVTRTVPSKPTSPEGCSSMSSRVKPSSSTAVTRAV